jgi:hypothetical protein
MPSPDVNLNNGDGKIDWVKSHEVFQWWVQEMERESEQTLEDQAVAIVNEVPQTVSYFQHCRLLYSLLTALYRMSLSPKRNSRSRRKSRTTRIWWPDVAPRSGRSSRPW